MKILAIDASTKSCGIAVFDGKKLIHYDCFTNSSTILIKRIKSITKEIKEIIEKYEIEKVVLEEVRPEDNKAYANIKTHRALMWLQASIAFAAYDVSSKISIDYLYPSEWRKICGIKNGRGIKRETLKIADKQFAKDKFNLDVNDDIADAVGIGYAFTVGDSNNVVLFE